MNENRKTVIRFWILYLLPVGDFVGLEGKVLHIGIFDKMGISTGV
jgi:hypothetical protein